MNLARPQRIAPFAVGVAALIVLAFLPVSLPEGDDLAVSRGKQPAGQITNGTVISQEFVSTGTSVTSLGLLLGSDERAEAGAVRVTLEAQRDGQWQMLASETAQEGDQRGATFGTIAFSPPLAVTINQPLRITAQSSPADTRPVTWWVSTGFARDGFALSVNGSRRDDTLCFTIAYGRASGRLVQMLKPVWQRISIFLNPGWQVMLLFGFALIAAGLMAIAWHLFGGSGDPPPDPLMGTDPPGPAP
jgi:hypothetical protein